MREEAATTAASYEAQLSVMSEHLARFAITPDNNIKLIWLENIDGQFISA